MKTLMCFLVLFSSLARAEFKAFDAELTQFTYPFPVAHLEVKYKDETFKMAYMDVAPVKENGKVVVLLHGKNFAGFYWEKTVKDLMREGYRVIVPDQIGFGKSTKPESLQYSFQQLASWTHELLQARGVKSAMIVGHSMGGMLATRYALMFPSEVTKLALINPIGLEDWKTMVPYRGVSELYQSELLQTADKIRQYQRDSYYGGQWKPEYEDTIKVAVGQTLHADYPRVAWNAALTADMIFTQPVVYEFKDLKVPTLLLIGTRDRTALGKGWADPKTKEKMGRYDVLGRQVARLIPKGRLIELKGIGHMPQVEAYDDYLKALSSFLK